MLLNCTGVLTQACGGPLCVPLPSLSISSGGHSRVGSSLKSPSCVVTIHLPMLMKEEAFLGHILPDRLVTGLVNILGTKVSENLVL